MKEFVLMFLAVVSIMTLALWFMARPAKCQWCYSGPCISSSICGSGCICVKRGWEPQGFCVGVQ
jgi:hypothetical protein